MNNEESSSIVKLCSKPGRPRIEEDQPEILEAIKKIAIFGSAAHERRQTNEIRTFLSLNKLKEKLVEEGYEIKKSALYTRLLPKNSSSHEGKKHIVTVPVKLCRPQNDEHKHHVDGTFCVTSIRYLESLASMLGPSQVCFISQDDKAKVDLGKTATNKQTAVAMHVEYRVKLPDHDWIVANKHKLIPSVYAGIIIEPRGMGDPKAITYSGPTYIAIRSGKHDSSTAESHEVDFERLLELEEFSDLMKINNKIKPVIIICTDGGPDENPRYCMLFTLFSSK